MTVRCVAVTLATVTVVSGLLNLAALFGDEGRARRAKAGQHDRAVVAARARSVRQMTWEQSQGHQ